MAHVAGPTAALAGIPAGLQSHGAWEGRRQLFVRFAAEAETATMYTVDALASEIKRATARSAFHSICVSGRDPLANVEYLRSSLDRAAVPLPVMLDCDGQRPDALRDLCSALTLVQVSLEGAGLDAQAERAFECLKVAADSGVQHALVLVIDERTSDGLVVRAVEQAHAASAASQIVLHPGAGASVDRDRRWTMLMERASAAHADIRFALRLPAPTGLK